MPVAPGEHEPVATFLVVAVGTGCSRSVFGRRAGRPYPVEDASGNGWLSHCSPKQLLGDFKPLPGHSGVSDRGI